MPIYTYICPHEECKNKEFDLIVKLVHRDSLKICPECQSDECKRKEIVLSNFKLKGSGFYATDYGSSSVNPKSSNKSQT